MQRRHLTREQKQQLIAAKLTESPEWSDRRIAKLLGVSPTTVGAVRSTVQLGQFDKRVGADGKERQTPKRVEATDEPKTVTAPPTVDDDAIVAKGAAAYEQEIAELKARLEAQEREAQEREEFLGQQQLDERVKERARDLERQYAKWQAQKGQTADAPMFMEGRDWGEWRELQKAAKYEVSKEVKDAIHSVSAVSATWTQLDPSLIAEALVSGKVGSEIDLNLILKVGKWCFAVAEEVEKLQKNPLREVK